MWSVVSSTSGDFAEVPSGNSESRPTCEKSDLYYQFKTLVLKKGDSLTIDTGVLHTFTSNLPSPCDFVEASTFHEDSDSYRVYKD